MSDGFWGMIGVLGAIFLKEYFDARRARNLAVELARKDAEQDKKLADIATNLGVVEKATNGLVDKLVESVKTEAHAAGVQEAREHPHQPSQ